MKLILTLSFIIFLGVQNIFAQCDCSTPIIPPQTINGLNITSTSSGSVNTYNNPFTSCGNVTTPANSIWLGQTGAFTYTLNFSAPIQEICVIITATGQTGNENFIFNTNSGVPTIIDQGSCSSSIVGNEIISGAGATNMGGGGTFQIVGSSAFTSITITGNGGHAGGLLAFCANSIVPPGSSVFGDTVVCQNDVEPEVTFVGDAATSPYTFTYTVDGGAEQTVTSVGDTATVSVPTNTPGTYVYDLISVEDANGNTESQSGTVTVVVNPLPEATILGDTIVCLDDNEPEITFTGSNSTAPYTFTYTINGGAPQTVTSTGDIATVSVPTNATGTFTYELVSVEDASAQSCSQNQTGTATVTVNPIPDASIAGDAEVCLNGNQPQITFSAPNSQGPLDFIYTINGGAQQTASASGNSTTINAPTDVAGTFVYELVDIDDNGSSSCSPIPSGNATVIVYPEPEVSFVGQGLMGCSPVCPEITSTVNAGQGVIISNYDWQLSNGMSASSQSPVWSDCIINNSSNSVNIGVTLTVTTENGCTSSHTESNYIQIGPNPIADFYFLPENPNVLENTVDFRNTSVNGDSYSWSFDGLGSSNEVNPSFTFPEEGNQDYYVELIATTDEGCQDTAYAIVNIADQIIFYVPNTFTPDGDKFNEVFQPVFTSGFEPMDYNLLLFNRWGEVIFESNNAKVGWDGTYGGKLVQDGTYVWKIEFRETMSDKRHIHTGHVNILK
jgi:gliding motility-associated-like protein